MDSENDQPSVTDPIQELRDEFASQFKALKDSYESDKQASADTIKALTEQNEELKRALIRSAVVPQQEQPKQPTEEELYKAQVSELSQQTLNIMKELI